MTVEHLHFTVDPLWAINFMMQRHHEKHYNFNDEHSKAVRFTLGDLLYNRDKSLTESEIRQIVDWYRGDDKSESFTVDATDEQAKGLFMYIFDLPRYKEIHWQYILKGYGPYTFSVIDLRAKKEYGTKEAHHYETLLNILSENYADEFNELSQQQKDSFIMENFKLIGKSYSMDWYTPDFPV